MVELICDPAEMYAIKNEWNKLAEPFGTPTLSYEWFAACAESFSQSGQLRIIVISSSQGVTAIAPLVLKRHNGMEKLELLGMSELFETGGFIYRDEKSLKEMAEAVVAMKKPLTLRRIRSESPEASVFTNMCRNRILPKLQKDAPSLFLPINMRWNEFEAMMPAGGRAGLRRKLRKAEKMGKVDFEVVSPGPDNLEPYLNEVFSVEASGWKGRNSTAILTNPSMHKFFNLYCREIASSGSLLLFFFRIDGETAAVRIAVEYANRLWELKIGYDEKWAGCSPGLLLTHKTIQYAFERGYEAYEFLGNDESWMHAWTGQKHSYKSLRIYPYSPGGLLSWGIDMAGTVARKAFKDRKRSI